MHFDGPARLSAIMTVSFAAFVGVAFSYSSEARLAPLSIGIPGLILCLAQLATDLRAARRGPEASQTDGNWVRANQLLGWLGLFAVSTVLFGIVFTALAPVFAFLKFDQKESLALSTSVSAGFAALLYAVFETLLGYSLFAGLAPGWLGM